CESRSAVYPLAATSTAHFLQGTAKKVRAHAVLALLLGVLVLTFAGCGKDDRNETTIVAPLSGDQEVPPRQTGGSGTITVTVDGQDQELSYVLELRGTFTSAIQQAHIHLGARGVNGPIFLFLCTNLTPPAGVPTPPACPTGAGTVAGTLTAANFIPVTGLASFAAALNSILAGDTYANVHSVTFPGGEVRGQIVP
ncbi:MAG: CHRD domain-containing protein, partial [Candidatus Entotheonellia bacterium]